jgi:Flp pilus assembly protein TadG
MQSAAHTPQCHKTPPCAARHAAATVELALVLPFLMFILVAAVDFARIFYFSITIANCARNGAMYGADESLADKSPYDTIEEAALADAQSLNPQPTVVSTQGADSTGQPYVQVTVTYPFRTVTGFPGVPRSIDISRTTRMRVTPSFDTP